MLTIILFVKNQNTDLKLKNEESRIMTEKTLLQYHVKKQELKHFEDSIQREIKLIDIRNDSLNEALLIVNKRIEVLNKENEKLYHRMDTASTNEILQYFRENFYSQ